MERLGIGDQDAIAIIRRLTLQQPRGNRDRTTQRVIGRRRHAITHHIARRVIGPAHHLVGRIVAGGRGRAIHGHAGPVARQVVMEPLGVGAMRDEGFWRACLDQDLPARTRLLPQPRRQAPDARLPIGGLAIDDNPPISRDTHLTHRRPEALGR